MTLHIEQKRRQKEVLELSAEDLDSVLRLLTGHADDDLSMCAFRLYGGSVIDCEIGDVKMWVETDE